MNVNITPMSKHPKGNASIKHVRLGDMRISPAAQREVKPAWVRELTANYDFDKAGVFTVSHRDGYYWIVDAQHRYLAQKAWVEQNLGEWEDWTQVANVYEGLTEAEEAELFLTFNSAKPVNGIDRFKVAVTAGRATEVSVQRIMQSLGLRVVSSTKPYTVSAIGAVLAAYKRGEDAHLRLVLSVLRDAWDGYNLSGEYINAVSDVLARFAGVIDADRLCAQLAGVKNGAAGVAQAASRAQDQFGCNKRASYAAAIVAIYNKGRGGKKLPSWFKDGDE